jgi:hypothetical protein
MIEWNRLRSSVHKILFLSVPCLKVECCMFAWPGWDKNFGQLVFLEEAARERETKEQTEATEPLP